MQLQEIALPQQHGFYSSCPRCDAGVLQVSDREGSLLCRDCSAEDEAVERFAELALSAAEPTPAS
jgi:hypothetical protein